MPDPLSPDGAPLPLVVTRPEALAAGLTRDQIRQRVRGGTWTTVHPGVYWRARAAEGTVDAYAAITTAHVLACVGVVRRHPHAVISGRSAALLHGLPLASGVPTTVEALVQQGAWRGVRAGVHYRLGQVPDGDVTPGLVPVTSAARTWVDLARGPCLADALSVGDRVLRTHLATRDEALDLLSRMGAVRGRRRARSAIAHADGRRETPLESLSWARFVAWGLRLPEVQHEVRDEEGFIGRVDFWWPGTKVVGEADGRLKYDSREALYAEKRREDRLRALGLAVIRWGWSDLTGGRSGERLRRRLTDAVSRP